MKRSPIRRRPRRNRPPVDWPSLLQAVGLRDRREMIRAGIHQTIVCIAPIVDPAERGKCWGRTTGDHVKVEPRMGVKADDVMEQLVSVCQGHSEDGRKAGHQWNTANRDKQREYLLTFTEKPPSILPVNSRQE